MERIWIIFALEVALLASFNPLISKRLLVDSDVSVVACRAWTAGSLLVFLDRQS